MCIQRHRFHCVHQPGSQQRTWRPVAGVSNSGIEERQRASALAQRAAKRQPALTEPGGGTDPGMADNAIPRVESSAGLARISALV